MSYWLTLPAGLAAGAVATTAYGLRRKRMDRWLPAYIQKSAQQAISASTYPDPDKPLHVFIAVCDHYEPQWGRPARAIALNRVERWRSEYPRLFSRFADSNGRPPQHTYFFPADEYAPEYLDILAELCHDGYGDVDVHLHHDNDTAEGLRDTLEQYKATLHVRHGLLRRDPVTNQIVYGFIHGNWALCNSRPDGRWCGVDHEIPVLLDTGCYADFTMPSAPSDTQTKIINSIYYIADHGRCSQNRGTPSAVGSTAPTESLLAIQGPLGFNWNERRWAVVPRVENGDVHATQPLSLHRLPAWLRAGVGVAGNPQWRFVKLHTHGAKPGNLDLWLSDRTAAFHRDLAAYAKAHPNFHYHYVTAWEMARLVKAAESGVTNPEAVLSSATARC